MFHGVADCKHLLWILDFQHLQSNLVDGRSWLPQKHHLSKQLLLFSMAVIRGKHDTGTAFALSVQVVKRSQLFTNAAPVQYHFVRQRM